MRLTEDEQKTLVGLLNRLEDDEKKCILPSLLADVVKKTDLSSMAFMSPEGAKDEEAFGVFVVLGKKAVEKYDRYTETKLDIN